LEYEQLMLEDRCARAGCEKCEGYAARIVTACDSVTTYGTPEAQQRYYEAVERFKQMGCAITQVPACSVE
jgi:hypothetical protein